MYEWKYFQSLTKDSLPIFKKVGISPFPKRNRQIRQKSTDGSRNCHIMTAPKRGMDDIWFIQNYIFQSISSLRS
jgi:hypothetical protein